MVCMILAWHYIYTVIIFDEESFNGRTNIRNNECYLLHYIQIILVFFFYIILQVENHVDIFVTYIIRVSIQYKIYHSFIVSSYEINE